MGSAKHGEPTAFLEMVLSSPPTDKCILWPYGTQNGYGSLRVNGKSRHVHRVVCEKVNGPAPKGYEAAHSCDVRLCINKRHLRWATHKENVQEAVERNRLKPRFGSDNGNAKLSVNDILNIRSEYGKDDISQECLAKFFNVSQPVISGIVRGTRWNHV